MRKAKVLWKRLFKTNSEEKALRAYNREKNEADIRQNEAKNLLYDIARHSQYNRYL